MFILYIVPCTMLYKGAVQTNFNFYWILHFFVYIGAIASMLMIFSYDPELWRTSVLIWWWITDETQFVELQFFYFPFYSLACVMSDEAGTSKVFLRVIIKLFFLTFPRVNLLLTILRILQKMYCTMSCLTLRYFVVWTEEIRSSRFCVGVNTISLTLGVFLDSRAEAVSEEIPSCVCTSGKLFHFHSCWVLGVIEGWSMEACCVTIIHLIHCLDKFRSSTFFSWQYLRILLYTLYTHCI